MPRIPNSINGVDLEFAPGVDNDALDMLIDGLRHTVSQTVAPAHRLSRLWVSSVRDSHACPSRHVTGNAVDLSRINGKRIAEAYPVDPEVKAIVQALQNRFESYLPHRRENFGPSLKLKLGRPHSVGGHQDHIHFSVSGPHPCPAPRWYERLFRPFRTFWGRQEPRTEICASDEGD